MFRGDKNIVALDVTMNEVSVVKVLYGEGCLVELNRASSANSSTQTLGKEHTNRGRSASGWCPR